MRVAAERLLLVALGVALETASMPPGPAPLLVFAVDVPFLWLLWHRGGRGWLWWALLYGFARYAVGVRWLAEVQWAFPFLVATFLAPVQALFGLAIRAAVARRVPFLLVVPTTAVFEEMLRTWYLGGMPWPARSLAFTAWDAFIGAASVFGAYGLSF